METLFKITDAARALRVSGETIRRWAREGRIRVVQTPGGHLRIPQDEINRVSKGETSTADAETSTRSASRAIQQKREAVEHARLEIELERTGRQLEDLEEERMRRRQERLAAEQRAGAEERARLAALRSAQEAERETRRQEQLQAAEEQKRRQAAAEAARRRRNFLDRQESLTMAALPYWATPKDRLRVQAALLEGLEGVSIDSSWSLLETIRQEALNRGLRLSRWRRMAEDKVRTTWGIPDCQVVLQAVLAALKTLDQENTDDIEVEHVIGGVISQFTQVEAQKHAIERGMAYVSSYLHRLQQNSFIPASLSAHTLMERYKSRVRTALQGRLQGDEDAELVKEKVEQVIDEILGL